ncbi:MAG: HAMP domain-containing histidine kinase [Candidatus Staskawiczbacteria bacterium]|nr:HAMP domain-containing histidine kinase [Candidatus Staskawiczbacteria bacterium]
MSIINYFFASPALCNFEAPTYLLLSSNVAPLVHYSHIPITIISLILGFFILFKNPKGLPNRILFCLVSAFSSWVFLDSIFWASNRSDVIMFVWSLQILFEPIVYISALYLLYLLIKKEDIHFNKKLLIALIYLPVIILVPTKYSLWGFNLSTCLSEESSTIIFLSYGIEILYALWIIVFSVREFIRAKTGEVKQQIVLLSTGTILLLLAFSSGNIISSFTEDWRFAQIGLLTMPIFIGFLVYSIVKFRTFNIKIILTQALVVALWIALFGVLFVTTIENVRVIVSLTLILFLIVGILLVRSVLREVRQREEIARMAEDVRRAYVIEKRAKEELEKLDKVKDQFLIITQHNLKTPLTSMMGYSDLLLNGTFGKQGVKTKEVVGKIKGLSQNMIKMVNDFLDMAQFQLGKSAVVLKPGIHLDPILDEIIEELRIKAEQKGIYLKLEPFGFAQGKNKKDVLISADREKLKAALSNVVDNAIKYTIKGGVAISIKYQASSIKVEVKDTGIGIPPEKIKTIFETTFERGEEAKRLSIIGTGVGLYLATKIIESHKGKIWAESEGEGKGSTFYIELPLS